MAAAPVGRARESPGIPDLKQVFCRGVQRRLDRAAARAESDRLLAFVGLGPQQRRRHTVSLRMVKSTGLRSPKTVALSVALLLVGEPTAGLSPEETRRTAETMLELNRQGVGARG